MAVYCYRCFQNYIVFKIISWKRYEAHIIHTQNHNILIMKDTSNIYYDKSLMTLTFGKENILTWLPHRTSLHHFSPTDFVIFCSVRPIMSDFQSFFSSRIWIFNETIWRLGEKEIKLFEGLKLFSRLCKFCV